MGVMTFTGAGGAALMRGAGVLAAAVSEAARSSASFRASLPSSTCTCMPHHTHFTPCACAVKT